MRQEDLNEMMRFPGENKATKMQHLPECPNCGYRYLGDGVALCLDCDEESRPNKEEGK